MFSAVADEALIRDDNGDRGGLSAVAGDVDLRGRCEG